MNKEEQSDEKLSEERVGTSRRGELQHVQALAEAAEWDIESVGHHSPAATIATSGSEMDLLPVWDRWGRVVGCVVN